MTENKKLEQALAYLKIQWIPIPVGIDKQPIVRWKPFQNVFPTDKQVTKWFTTYPTANIAIVTGTITKLIVVDIDPRHEGTNELFKDIQTVCSKTGGGGWHYFFLYEEAIGNHVGVKPGIDIRSNGGYVIVPQSIHESGNQYEWINSPFENTPIAPLPDFVRDWIKEKKVRTYQPTRNKKGKNANRGKFDESILEGVSEGKRNNAAASYAGYLFASIPQDEWDTIWEILVIWNKRNQPPIEEEELRKVYESIRERELQKQNEEDKNDAIILAENLQKEQAILFHDDLKVGYVAIHGNGKQILKIHSGLFERYISHLFYKQTGKAISSSVLENTIRLFEGRALFEGEEYELNVRIAFRDNAVWYDFGEQSIGFIDKDGWSISETPPILFKRFLNQKPQIMPKRGERLEELLSFINVEEENDKLLLLVYTVAAFIPGFPHPILVFHGPQGSGKTTPQILLKSLIDPSQMKVMSAPDSIREFVQQASHHYFFFYDNLTKVPEWLSNALARAVTGDGFSKRTFYTDDDDFIYSFQRNVALNGITVVVQKADLLERSILIGLKRIHKSKRKRERDIIDAFEYKKPYLLGAIFDAVAGAIREYDNIKLSEYPRMADFCHWGCAISKALGYTQEQFLQAYNANREKQNTEAIDANPVATTIMELLKNQSPWIGTASQLLTALESHTEANKINIKAAEWPKDAASLSRKLHIVQTNLAEEGIYITTNESVRPKIITIQKQAKNTDNGDKGDMPTESNVNEVGNDMSGFSQIETTLDNNRDNNNQSENDALTGLSASAVNSQDEVIPDELLLLQGNSHWAQYFPLKPLSNYTDGQIETAISILNDYKEKLMQLLQEEKLYISLQMKFQQEVEKRKE